MAPHPDPSAFRRGLVEVEGRQLHFLRHGTGPAVVLLHASPCSARVMAPLQALWGAEFTTFAFDLPGFGLSDPPDGAEITIADLARLIAGAMAALGIRRPALYGRHTGASVALEIARTDPDGVALLLTDGLPIFASAHDDARLADYLPPIRPAWDGSHLIWAFYRYREQHIFWPWDRPLPQNRADADLPDAEFLHRGTLELLESAPDYARVYRAAFRYDSLAGIAGLACPAIFGNRPGDSQFPTMARYPDPSQTHVLPRDPELAARAELELLRRHRGPDHDRPHDPGPPGRARPGDPRSHARPGRRFLPTRHGDVHARTAGGADGRPVLLLHDLPGGIDLHPERWEALARTGPVAGFDLSGNAESRSARPPDPGIWCDQIEDVAAALGWDSFDLHAIGTGAVVALALAHRRPERLGRITLQSPPLRPTADRAILARHGAPDITPTADGAHLLRLWHHLRDAQLWLPGPDRSHRSRRQPGPGLAPEALNRRAITLLKQPWHFRPMWRLLIEHDLAGALAGCPVAVQLTTDPDDPFGADAAAHATRPTP